MDYAIRPTNRKEARLCAKIFRNVFNLPPNGPINPLDLLDKISYVYGNANYEIVEDSELPYNIPAQCIRINNDEFVIQIAESVFNGAYERNIGGYRAHILHEIVHPFADKIGFKPIFNRTFKNKKIPAYMSLEWVVKAITGEIMMPYEETIGLSEKELMERYGVSQEAARHRLTY